MEQFFCFDDGVTLALDLEQLLDAVVENFDFLNKD